MLVQLPLRITRQKEQRKELELEKCGCFRKLTSRNSVMFSLSSILKEAAIFFKVQDELNQNVNATNITLAFLIKRREECYLVLSAYKDENPFQNNPILFFFLKDQNARSELSFMCNLLKEKTFYLKRKIFKKSYDKKLAALFCYVLRPSFLVVKKSYFYCFANQPLSVTYSAK